MTKTKLNPLLQLAVMAMLGLFISFAIPAQATTMAEVLISAPEHGSQESFVKDEYRGQVDRFELGDNPMEYLRHDNAYQVLKLGFEIALGHTLTDRQFNRLLKSDDVQLTACIGKITTTGIDKDGNVSWFTRDCKRGENLVQILVNHKLITIASDYCWNLVNGELVKPTPEPIVMSGGGFTPVTPTGPEVCTTDCPVVPTTCEQRDDCTIVPTPVKGCTASAGTGNCGIGLGGRNGTKIDNGNGTANEGVGQGSGKERVRTEDANQGIGGQNQSQNANARAQGRGRS